ncbi:MULTISPECIES: hypothetical protein [Streptomyces]|uniref:hypothetical protein n=1 Tax=Streptomyces TaxID=1883 RepID=UPI000A3E80EE|nr:hypothetical protein [Streptomyces durhamensis]
MSEGPEGHGEPAGASAVRRGRHRKPRPRKVLLAAGGLALAAGALSLLRVTPDSGVGVPGTAEAEPRPDGGATDHAGNTAAAVAASPTALPSATSVMGGRALVPAAPAPGGARTGPATPTAPPGSTAAPNAARTGPASAPGTPARPSPTTSAPPPAPTPSRPAPATPAPTHGSADPGPGGLCVPVLGLCVDAHGHSGHSGH